MVKKTLLTLLTLLLNFAPAVLLIAGEFTASVNETQVPATERISLTLTLSGANPIEAPDVTALRSRFLIHSQQLASHTSIVNGRLSSNISWKLSLTAMKVGAMEIPAIPVETNLGRLATKPITITVTEGLPAQKSEETAEVSLKASVNNASPYKNEPFIYTAVLISKMPLYHVKMQKVQTENAIIEMIQEPKLEERVVDGTRRNVIEFSYLITPLKAGTLTVPPIAVEGATPQSRDDSYRSLFRDEPDPFIMFRGFDALKPFTLLTEAIEIDVQPAVGTVSPWLPAQGFTVADEWPSDQPIRVGEPVSRRITLKATGVKASQIPSLEDWQNPQGTSFKVYADLPEQQEKVGAGDIHSTRTEQYTLIPQQAGSVKLPEISVDWWDTKTKQKRTATIPARTVQVLPAVTTSQAAPAVPLTGISVSEPQLPLQPTAPLWLYAVICTLILLLFAVLGWAITLQRRISRDAGKKASKEKLPDLNPT